MKTLRLAVLFIFVFPLMLFAQGSGDCTGAYQNNQPHGVWICKFANNPSQTQMEITYNEGVINGLKKDYYENAQIKQTSSYLNGSLDGETKAYYEDGTLKYQGSFSNGQPVGTHKEYDSAGTLIKEESF